MLLAHGGGGKSGATVRIWDLESGNNIAIVSDIPSGVRALAWSPDGVTLAIGSRRGVVRLIEPRTGDAKRDWQLKLEERTGGVFQEEILENGLSFPIDLFCSTNELK